MSEFIEKLKRGTQHTPAPMGFRSEPAKDKPKILLIACITEPTMKNAEDLLAGADAGLFDYEQPCLRTGIFAKIYQNQTGYSLGWMGEKHSMVKKGIPRDRS